MMLRNFHALAGLSMLFLVSACGAAAPDSEELVGQESSDLFSCNPAVGLAPAVPGGPTSIGSSSPDSVIVSIQGTGPTLTFTQRSISTGQTTTTSFALGLNVTATGGIGSPTSLTYIEAMYTSTNSWNFYGTEWDSSGADHGVSGTITFSGVSVNAGFQVDYLSGAAIADATAFSFFAQRVGGGAPRTLRAQLFNTACGLSVSEAGSSDLGTLSGSAPGASSAEFWIDGEIVAGFTGGGPYSKTYDLAQLPVGSHVLTLKAFDSANNHPSVQTTFGTVPTCYPINRIYDPGNLRLGAPCFKYGTPVCGTTQGTMQSECAITPSTCGYLYCR